MNKRPLCNNCGICGHFTKNCSQPISSFGIILFRKCENQNRREYLMICRQKTYGYIDFISGNYHIFDYKTILEMFKQMSKHEKELIQNNDYKVLWKELWKSHTNVVNEVTNNSIKQIRSKFIHENARQNKYNYVKTHYLHRLFQDSLLYGNWEEPEWEFPKGRKNYNESEYHCALRETTEETGYSNTLFNVVTMNTFDEVFTGSNKKRYRNNYYLMAIDYDKTEQRGKMDLSEVSMVKWKSFDECNKTIRFYNTEKKSVLEKIDTYLQTQ